MKSKKRHAGFTLIEIMVVVAIIGILAVAVGPRLLGRADDARVARAKTDVLTLENALDLYRLDNGFYPSQDQGLEALVQRPTTPPEPRRWQAGGYIQRISLDPWDNSYQYRNPGLHSEIDVFSFGADGLEGGEGYNAEIGNWD